MGSNLWVYESAVTIEDQVERLSYFATFCRTLIVLHIEACTTTDESQLASVEPLAKRIPEASVFIFRESVVGEQTVFANTQAHGKVVEG